MQEGAARTPLVEAMRLCLNVIREQAQWINEEQQTRKEADFDTSDCMRLRRLLEAEALAITTFIKDLLWAKRLQEHVLFF